MLKKILHNAIVKKLIFLLGFIYITLLYHTTRWKIINEDSFRKYKNDKNSKSRIILFWHGRVVAIPLFTLKPKQSICLTSPHKDGIWSAGILPFFGIKTVDASTNKNGAKGIRTILKSIKNNYDIGIIPDGPRGPRMRIPNKNIFILAKQNNIEICIMTYAIKKCKFFASWDRFLLPSLFSKGIFYFDIPLSISEYDKHTPDELHKIIEEKMVLATNYCDKEMGIEIIMPAEQAKHKRDQ